MPRLRPSTRRALFRTLRAVGYKRLPVLVTLICLFSRMIWQHLKRTRLQRIAKRVVNASPSPHLQRILASCPEVDSPRYVPPAWAANRWLNLGLFVAKGLLCKHAFPIRLAHEEMRTPDGALISIDWADDDVTRALPEDAPILIVSHTITGRGEECGYFLKEAGPKGFRGCVLNRRGHAEPLQTASFNVIGDVEDCRQQIALVHKRYPGAWLGLAGVSMGSALVVNFLGHEGDNTPVRAGCVLCPAYDITSAFVNLEERFPRMDRFVLDSMKRLWCDSKNGNLETLQRGDPIAAEACLRAATTDQFIRAHVPFSGRASYEEFMDEFNPMQWCQQIKRSVLVLNSNDDMISLPCNIREDLAEEMPSAVLVRTDFGTHIAYSEGSLGTGNYMSRISFEFLLAAYRTDDEYHEHKRHQGAR